MIAGRLTMRAQVERPAPVAAPLPIGGETHFGALAPAPTESALGDVWVDDDGGIHDRVGGAIILDGAILEIGGFVPALYWTPSAVQVDAANLSIAHDAVQNANAALLAISDLAQIDSVSPLTITAAQKAAVLVPEQARLEVVWVDLVNVADALGLVRPKAAAFGARAAWLAFLASMRPAWDDTTHDSVVRLADFVEAASEYAHRIGALNTQIEAFIRGAVVDGAPLGDAPTVDDWSNALPPVFQPVGAPVACFIYSKTARELVDDTKTARIEDVRGLFSLRADIMEGDEITNITDRRGVVLIPGRLKVEGPVQHKHTHREAALQRIG